MTCIRGLLRLEAEVTLTIGVNGETNVVIIISFPMKAPSVIMHL